MKSQAIRLQRIKKQYKIFPYKFKIEEDKYYMYLDNKELNDALDKLDYSNLSHDTEYLIFSIQENYVNSIRIESGEVILIRIEEHTGDAQSINLGNFIQSKEDLMSVLGL